MSKDRLSPRRAIAEGDPLPPDERAPRAELQSPLERLYRDRADNLILHFTQRTRDPDVARDIVHEAFAKFASLSFARRLIIGSPEAYLYRICINLVRDRQRSLVARTDRDGPLVDADCHSPFAELEHRDRLRRLERAMLRLPRRTRDIFLAKRLDGMSYAEIAEWTGLSVKGVEKHMTKAIAAVARELRRDSL